MDLSELLNLSGNVAGSDGQPASKPSPLQSLKVDLDFYSDSIKEMADEMIAEKYTDKPIFIATQHEVTIGELMLDKKELSTNWSIYASSVEEFLERGIIQESKKSVFEKSYKDPKRYMCVFVVVPEGANYVFYPYR